MQHDRDNVRPGAENVQHGVTNVRHGAKDVWHGPKNVRHGAKNVQHVLKMCGMVPKLIKGKAVSAKLLETILTFYLYNPVIFISSLVILGTNASKNETFGTIF